MTAPTVPVTVRLADFGGSSEPGIVVTARMSDVDYMADGTFVANGPVEGTTDVDGLVTLNLFPNAAMPSGLGTRGTTVRVRATLPNSRRLSVIAVIPNEPCSLASCVVNQEPTGLDLSQQAASDAQAARNLAKRWATQTDAEVEAGQGFGAKKYAQDAAADHAQTALDRIATGEDRVQTGLDQQATAADRVQTGLDRTQTGLDRTAAAGSAAAAAGAVAGYAGDVANVADSTKGAALVGFDGGTVAGRVRSPHAALSNWFRGSLSGKKMAWVGDSTTFQIQNTSQNLNYLVNNYQSAGGPLAGVTLQWFGANGNSLANFIVNTPAGSGASDVIAATPDLIVFSYGINDVRLGATSQATLLANLKTAINTLRNALPACDIVLRMPNSLLTTDVGANGYVTATGLFAGMTLAQASQAATDILRNAYRALKDYWPNVVLYDAQESTFPSTSPATSALMTDQLHPSTAGGAPPTSTGGFAKIIDDVAELTGSAPSAAWLAQYPGRAPRYNQASAVDAVAASYANAHLTYPRVVENGDYELITQGAFVTQGSGFIRFAGDLAQIGNIAGGDIVVQDGVAAFTLPQFPAVTVNGTNIQIASLGGGVPAYAQTSGSVSVWRHKYVNNAASKPYVKDTAYPHKQRFLINTGGVNFIRLAAMPNGKDPHAFTFAAGDFLLHPDLGPIALTSATYAFQAAGVIQINVTGDFTLVTGHYQCMVVGQGQNGQRAAAASPMPIRFEKSTVATVTGAGTQVVSRGGFYSRHIGKLSTALTTTSTVIAVKKNGSTVATVTFTASNAASTVSYASGSGFTVLPGDTMTYDVTAVGTGTADMSLVFDV